MAKRTKGRERRAIMAGDCQEGRGARREIYFTVGRDTLILSRKEAIESVAALVGALATGYADNDMNPKGKG